MEKAFTELSKEFSFRRQDRGYRVVSLPKGMDFVNGSFRVTEKIPTIAIVDVFSDFGNFKIAPGIKVPHGNIVTKYAVNGLEDKIGVLAFDSTPVSRGGTNEFRAICDALKDLAEIQNKYHNITAVNLSVGFKRSYETLYEDFSPDFFEKGKEDIAELLHKAKQFSHIDKERKDRYTLAYYSIEAINKLVKDGVEVYSSSGNAGEDGFNLLSLSKAQHIVSAYDFHKATHRYSTEQEQGVHTFYKNYNSEGDLINVTDGIIEFKPEEITSRNKRIFDFILGRKHTIKGTSFSCPIKLNKDIKNVY